MADMYSIVKKQDEKIDELLKVNKQNNEMLSSIETRMVSMSTQPTAQNESRGKIEVELPPNIATDESVRAAIKTGLAVQTKEIIKALNLRELPNLIRDAFKEIMQTAFKAGFDASILEALDKAMDKAMSKQVARLTDSANSLYYKVQSIIEGHWWKVTPKWVFGIILLLLSTVIGLTIGCAHLYNENEELRKTEWLYRGQRNGHISEEAQKLLINREKEFFTGSKHEQDSIKDNIRYWEHERGLDKMFLYFAPTEE